MTAMKITRRGFLQASGSAAGIMLSGLGFDLSAAERYAAELRIKGAKETTSVCCFCAVGCGLLIHTKDGKVINAEGDPDHPVSEGSLCSKGSAAYQVVNNDSRVLAPLYRAPGAKEWKVVKWDWALDQIARRIKDTRDKTFKAVTSTKIREKKVDGTPDEAGIYRETFVDVERQFTVNRTDGIAHVGSAALDNEECYLLQKLVRSWGVVHVEHQARL